MCYRLHPLRFPVGKIQSHVDPRLIPRSALIVVVPPSENVLFDFFAESATVWISTQ